MMSVSSSPIVQPRDQLGLDSGLDETDTLRDLGAGRGLDVGWTTFPGQDQLGLDGAGRGLDKMIMRGLDGLDDPPPFRGGPAQPLCPAPWPGEVLLPGRGRRAWERSHHGKSLVRASCVWDWWSGRLRVTGQEGSQTWRDRT